MKEEEAKLMFLGTSTIYVTEWYLARYLLDKDDTFTMQFC